MLIYDKGVWGWNFFIYKSMIDLDEAGFAHLPKVFPRGQPMSVRAAAHDSSFLRSVIQAWFNLLSWRENVVFVKAKSVGTLCGVQLSWRERDTNHWTREIGTEMKYIIFYSTDIFICQPEAVSQTPCWCQHT